MKDERKSYLYLDGVRLAQCLSVACHGLAHREQQFAVRAVQASLTPYPPEIDEDVNPNPLYRFYM